MTHSNSLNDDDTTIDVKIDGRFVNLLLMFVLL